jgi:hypothetical protein
VRSRQPHNFLRAARVALLALLVSCHPLQGAGKPTDLDGKPTDPFAQPSAATVLVFVTTECPISNRYAPEVGRLSGLFRPLGVKFWLVYPSALDSVTKIRAHLQQYHYSLPALLDPEGVLVKRAKAERTPEAAVFRRNGVLAYSGRIDDRFVDFLQERVEPRQHDLEAALSAVLRGGNVVPARREAVGCSIVQR